MKRNLLVRQSFIFIISEAVSLGHQQLRTPHYAAIVLAHGLWRHALGQLEASRRISVRPGSFSKVHRWGREVEGSTGPPKITRINASFFQLI